MCTHVYHMYVVCIMYFFYLFTIGPCNIKKITCPMSSTKAARLTRSSSKVSFTQNEFVGKVANTILTTHNTLSCVFSSLFLFFLHCFIYSMLHVNSCVCTTHMYNNIFIFFNYRLQYSTLWYSCVQYKPY